jgi:hypothetical protein
MQAHLFASHRADYIPSLLFDPPWDNIRVKNVNIIVRGDRIGGKNV